MVELELLQRPERPVTLLGQLQRPPLERARLVEAIFGRVGLAQKGERDEDHARDGEHRPDRKRQRGHALASARSSR